MNKQAVKLEKVKKSCKTARMITRIMGTILVVATILCLVGAIVSFCFGPEINMAITTSKGTLTMDSISTGGLINFDLNPQDMTTGGNYNTALIIYCIFGAVACAFCSAIFWKIHKIFDELETSGSPFNETVLRTLKRAFIVISVLIFLFVGVGTGLILGLFLWCIYCIMDYGCALQEEIDETV